jgi:hypothetical protein
MRVILSKVTTTYQERNIARAMQADFGGLNDDLPADADILFRFDADDQQPRQEMTAPSVEASANPQAPLLAGEARTLEAED